MYFVNFVVGRHFQYKIDTTYYIYVYYEFVRDHSRDKSSSTFVQPDLKLLIADVVAPGLFFVF